MSEQRMKPNTHIDQQDGLEICDDCKTQVGESADQCLSCALFEAEFEIEQLKKDMEPFMAQITQAKTYEVGEAPVTYKVSEDPSSGDMQEEKS